MKNFISAILALSLFTSSALATDFYGNFHGNADSATAASTAMTWAGSTLDTNNIYVDPQNTNAIDNNQGTGKNRPYKTLGGACYYIANSGISNRTIFILPGTTTETVGSYSTYAPPDVIVPSFTHIQGAGSSVSFIKPASGDNVNFTQAINPSASDVGFLCTVWVPSDTSYILEHCRIGDPTLGIPTDEYGIHEATGASGHYVNNITNSVIDDVTVYANQIGYELEDPHTSTNDSCYTLIQSSRLYVIATNTSTFPLALGVDIQQLAFGRVKIVNTLISVHGARTNLCVNNSMTNAYVDLYDNIYDIAPSSSNFLFSYNNSPQGPGSGAGAITNSISLYGNNVNSPTVLGGVVNIYPNSYTGNGSGLTNIPPTAISAGNLPATVTNTGPLNATALIPIAGGVQSGSLPAGLRYAGILSKDSSSTSSVLRQQMVTHDGTLTNFYFTVYADTAIGSGTNFGIYFFTNAIGSSPVNTGLLIGLSGGSGSIIQASNLTFSIPVTAGEMYQVGISNNPLVMINVAPNWSCQEKITLP